MMFWCSHLCIRNGDLCVGIRRQVAGQYLDEYSVVGCTLWGSWAKDSSRSNEGFQLDVKHRPQGIPTNVVATGAVHGTVHKDPNQVLTMLPPGSRPMVMMGPTGECTFVGSRRPRSTSPVPGMVEIGRHSRLALSSGFVEFAAVNLSMRFRTRALMFRFGTFSI